MQGMAAGTPEGYGFYKSVLVACGTSSCFTFFSGVETAARAAVLHHGVSRKMGLLLGDPHNKDCNILGSTLGPHHLWKLLSVKTCDSA